MRHVTALSILALVLFAGCTPSVTGPTQAELTQQLAAEMAIQSQLQEQLAILFVSQEQATKAKQAEFADRLQAIQARIDKHTAWTKQNKHPESFAAKETEKLLASAQSDLKQAQGELSSALESIAAEFGRSIAVVEGKLATQRSWIEAIELQRSGM